MMKNNVTMLFPIALLFDLLIPFALAPCYNGYSHVTQVMSVLGNHKAPLHVIYNCWLVVLGLILIVCNVKLYQIISELSKPLAILIFLSILLYAIGGCILSGFFSVEETKSLVTFSQKVHGYGSVIGFMALLFTPFFLAIYGFQVNHRIIAIGSLSCFILAILCFTLFVMADKPSFHNTIISFEGLWQRLSLLFMYLPIALFCILK